MSFAGLAAGRFNDVGINGALGEPVGIADAGRLFLENVDKEIADDFAF